MIVQSQAFIIRARARQSGRRVSTRTKSSEQRLSDGSPTGADDLCKPGGKSFYSSRRRRTRLQGDWNSDVCSSDLKLELVDGAGAVRACAASDTPVRPVDTETLNVQAIWQQPAQPPSSAAGMHRHS